MKKNALYEAAVPIPATRGKTGLTEKIRNCPIGMSFPWEPDLDINATQKAHASAFAAGAKISVRSTGNGQYRIWKLS